MRLFGFVLFCALLVNVVPDVGYAQTLYGAVACSGEEKLYHCHDQEKPPKIISISCNSFYDLGRQYYYTQHFRGWRNGRKVYERIEAKANDLKQYQFSDYVTCASSAKEAATNAKPKQWHLKATYALCNRRGRNINQYSFRGTYTCKEYAEKLPQLIIDKEPELSDRKFQCLLDEEDLVLLEEEGESLIEEDLLRLEGESETLVEEDLQLYGIEDEVDPLLGTVDW